MDNAILDSEELLRPETLPYQSYLLQRIVIHGERFTMHNLHPERLSSTNSQRYDVPGLSQVSDHMEILDLEDLTVERLNRRSRFERVSHVR